MNAINQFHIYVPLPHEVASYFKEQCFINGELGHCILSKWHKNKFWKKNRGIWMNISCLRYEYFNVYEWILDILGMNTCVTIY